MRERRIRSSKAACPKGASAMNPSRVIAGTASGKAGRPMLGAVAAALIAAAADAGITSFVVTKAQTSSAGVNLDVYTLWARFDGATDTVVSAFNFRRTDGAATNIFYHKDNEWSNAGVLTKSHGTWNPTQTGSPSNNRPFDSYLTIGHLANATNSSFDNPSWGGASWVRPDVPMYTPGSDSSDQFLAGLLTAWGPNVGSPYDLNSDGVVNSADLSIAQGTWSSNGTGVGWFNSGPPNLQGQVGQGANTATDVRLGQFVLDRDAFGGTWNLKVGFNSGVAGAPVQFAETTFSFAEGTYAIPAPGVAAMLAMAGLTRRRRRMS